MIRHDNIDADLQALAFDFFYWFSRFEFALKEAGHLRCRKPGSPAEPCWKTFVERHEADYRLSAQAVRLIEEAPKRQIVTDHGLDFRDVGFDDKPSDLGKVVRLVKTVRNNVFHGGKHGLDAWDDPPRTRMLMGLVIDLLDELAEVGCMENDYKRKY